MKTKRSRSALIPNSRWTAYATAGAATALAGAQSAEAAIHYVSVNQNFTPASGASTISSFTLGAGASFAVRAYHHASPSPNGHFSFAMGGAVSAAFVGYITSLYTVPRYVSRLLAGDNIGAHTNFVTNAGYFAYAARHGYGQFAQAGVGFIGIRFNTGAGIQYGWIRVNMGGPPGDPFTLVDYAWGDVGDSITAGQTSIPEPGSLGLLAMGAAGLIAWRKRRGQTAQA